MAAAETARLIASLELQDKNFTRGIKNVERGVGRVDKKLSAFGGFVNRNLARGIDRAAASLVDGVFAGVESLKELEQQQAQTNAVIKSTGSIAGVSGEQVTNLAEKYESLNAIIGDEVIRSGENMLLTFTNIRKDAFEPTLEAVLDMNTALGKGPEGLTSTAMQVGKALNDPTKGITKLTRAGVTFSKSQIKQIKALQKSGDLLGAQKIILAELNKEFGGSFAAQGDTTAGKVAKFNDAIEDLQRTFAKALLPIISKVADKLGTFLGDPAVMKAVEEAGVALGDAFDGLLKTAERLPWREIGQGLGIARDAAKGILDAFLSMPPWVQTLLIGGVVANKLTGGLVKDLASGLIKGVLGINAGVVNLKAATVVGGGAPVGGGGGAGGGKGIFGKLGSGLKIIGAVSIAGASIVALAEAWGEFQTTVTESQTDLQEKVNETQTQGFKETVANLEATSAGLKKMNGFQEILASTFGGGQITQDFESAADRIGNKFKAGQLSREDMIAALGPLAEASQQGKELNLDIPKTNALLNDLITAVNKGATKPPGGPGGAPGAFRPPAKGAARPQPAALRSAESLKPLTTKVAATNVALSGIKTGIATTGAAQKAELGNVKNAVATMDQNQKAAIIAQTAVNTAGNLLSVFQSASQVLAAAGTTTAANNTKVAVGNVSPPITGAISSMSGAVVGAIWAARPVIQSTNVVNNYTTRQRTGSTSGSRNTSPLSTHRG